MCGFGGVIGGVLCVMGETTSMRLVASVVSSGSRERV